MSLAAASYKNAQESTEILRLESFGLLGSAKAAEVLAQSAEVSSILGGFALLLGSNSSVIDTKMPALGADDDMRALRAAFSR